MKPSIRSGISRPSSSRSAAPWSGPRWPRAVGSPPRGHRLPDDDPRGRAGQDARGVHRHPAARPRHHLPRHRPGQEAGRRSRRPRRHHGRQRGQPVAPDRPAQRGHGRLQCSARRGTSGSTTRPTAGPRSPVRVPRQQGQRHRHPRSGVRRSCFAGYVVLLPSSAPQGDRSMDLLETYVRGWHESATVDRGDLAGELDDADWARPTDCDEWTVKDVDGAPRSPGDRAVPHRAERASRADRCHRVASAYTALGVEARRDRTPAELVAEFAAAVELRAQPAGRPAGRPRAPAPVTPGGVRVELGHPAAQPLDRRLGPRAGHPAGHRAAPAGSTAPAPGRGDDVLVRHAVRPGQAGQASGDVDGAVERDRRDAARARGARRRGRPGQRDRDASTSLRSR